MNDTVQFQDGEEIDFSGIEEGSFEALPKATYDVVIDDCEFGTSQSSGNPMWTITLQVDGGEFAGRKLFAHMTFHDKGLPMTKRFLNRVVPELANTRFNPADPEVLQKIIGKKCRAKVGTRLYDGEMRNNVKDILPASEGTFLAQ